jgi:transcriptional/translational regulatory protein YebC/TACO1
VLVDAEHERAVGQLVLEHPQATLALPAEPGVVRAALGVVPVRDDGGAQAGGGAEDVEAVEDGHTVYTAFDALSEVAQALEKALGEAKSTAVAWRPKSRTPVSGEAAASLVKLLEALEDDDDVQNVYANEDIPAEEMERLAS